MWFFRDVERFFDPLRALPVRVLIGPRQCGKTSLAQRLGRQAKEPVREIFLDDTQMRTLADREPKVVLGLSPQP